jgi:hypothetical protein
MASKGMCRTCFMEMIGRVLQLGTIITWAGACDINRDADCCDTGQYQQNDYNDDWILHVTEQGAAESWLWGHSRRARREGAVDEALSGSNSSLQSHSDIRSF